MLDIDVLRGELERLFELDELQNLSRDLLGFDPERVGGTAAKGSFARALMTFCDQQDAVEALYDAVLATKANFDPEFLQARLMKGSDNELASGESLGSLVISRKLGEGKLGVSYLAKHAGAEVRVKVLHGIATRDRRGLQRFLTLNRLLSMLEIPGLPNGLTTETVGERVVVHHAYLEAQSLAARLVRAGPMHLNELRPLLKAMLEPLAKMHERRLPHGNLKLENVLVGRDLDGEQTVLLLDAGCDRLDLRDRISNGHDEWLGSTRSPKTVAPEQIRGVSSDARSDVYSFGAMLYELLSGRVLFEGKSTSDTLIDHLSSVPPPPSSVAPRGWIGKGVDEFVLLLLHKDPTKRPQSAGALLDALEAIGRSKTVSTVAKISDERLEQCIDALLDNPADEDAAMALETCVEEGADARRISEAFSQAAAKLEADSDKSSRQAKKDLLFRAARLCQHEAKDLENAERIYCELIELDDSDQIATAALEEVRRKLGKFEDLVEMLLLRSEKAESRTERARAMAEIGRVYADDLKDREQALVAFTQAFCEDTHQTEYADEIERLAGTNQDAYSEVLSTCAAALSDAAIPAESKNILATRVGRWYLDKVKRPDLALPCYQAVIASDPANETALAGMTQIYRQAQQWPELGMVLARRADAAATPARARDLRAEAADVLEQRLNDVAGARALYEQILVEDPDHESARDALAKLYERGGDFEAYARLLARRVEAARGEEKLRLLCRLAELHEDKLGNDAEAIRRYQQALVEQPSHLDALRALDRLYSKIGNYPELLQILRAEAGFAATPRQKIALFERIAGIHDEEFLDHEQAALACQAVLEIDPTHENTITTLIRHLRALDRWEEVVALYERQLKLVTEPARRLDLLLASARVFGEQIGSPDRAVAVYEKVLALQPEHSAALEALARLRESSGDSDAALSAIEALAAQASSPEAKAEQFVRAAKLLEARGDRDRAIELYKHALDANAKNSASAVALKEAYLARGDVNAAFQLLERELENTDGDRAKAKLAGEMALLARERLKDDKRAKEAAERAVTYDPTNLHALIVLGDLAFEGNRHLEASKHYETLAERADTLEKRLATRILVRYVDALSQTGSTEKALAPMDTLLRIAPEDLEALLRVAHVTFDHGSPKRAVELYKDIIRDFDARLVGKERALTMYRYGEALRQSEQADASIQALEEASDLDPSDPLPLRALALAHESKQAFSEVIKAKTRHLDLATGDERFDLLLQIGEIAADKLGDRTQAAKNFVLALEDRPDDRKLLSKLMQLYSEEKDWHRLIEVVLRLAEFVQDPKQKVKYLHTAAIVSARQMGDIERALGFYQQVLELDPGMDSALEEALELEKNRNNHKAVEALLKRRLEVASKSNDQERMLSTFDELGRLYEKGLGWTNQAIDAYEAAQTLDPENRLRAELLAELYASDPEQYLDKAVAAQAVLLRQNPYRQESYKLLRRLYTEAKQADASWSLCQALYVLNLAEPDEERFFKRFRAETAAPAQDVLADEDWLGGLMHADANPLLTSVFALIEPAVIMARGMSLDELGYDPRYAIDLSLHPYPISQWLHYAAGVLGIDPPPTFQNANDAGGLSFLHAHAPSIVLGHAALSADVPPQAAAFIAARHLTYFRPGMYVRHLVASGTGLKSWLFASIKMIVPQFPVAAELEGPVSEALQALEAGMAPQARDHLARVVSKLLSAGAALDLKQWVAGVDLTADRAGMLIAHDLETAVEIIKASDEGSSAIPNQERMKELVLYAVSPPYFRIRRKLGIAIDA